MDLYEAIEIICDDYCKYPDVYSGNQLADICDKCPMNKCEELRWADRKDETTTQTETQNSNLTFEKADEFEQFDREALILLIECQRERIAELLAKDEPQYDFGEYADRLWKIAYERGKREALEQTEPSCDTCKLKDTTEWCKRQEVCRAYKPKDEPKTETEIAKAIVHKMIDNSVIAEDAYPSLRQRMHEAVERLDEYYPSEDERSE